ncbi:DUF4348 domain-containing protein [Chryseolinea sp. H1M3-3]|uniref:DUF4348 domain-containing protein n=1 Tax=Chryseolinea sp. H1M3-3 TaxID=3034144 RepID=UPI0023EC4628|nr:DUF4348 domain-containing protein [Chryseolinea sp. H1M3-3]
MNKNLFILTFLLLLSCGIRSTDPSTSSKDSLKISKLEDGEEFNEFFEKFTTDSLFQIERIKFPFRVLWTTEDGETVHETAKDDWTHSTFYYEDSYASRQVDAYTQETKNYGDTIKLELRGVDNGIFVDYNFVRQKGKWILVSGKGFSN